MGVWSGDQKDQGGGNLLRVERDRAVQVVMGGGYVMGEVEGFRSMTVVGGRVGWSGSACGVGVASCEERLTDFINFLLLLACGPVAGS